jgi:hypothetical protein
MLPLNERCSGQQKVRCGARHRRSPVYSAKDSAGPGLFSHCEITICAELLMVKVRAGTNGMISGKE